MIPPGRWARLGAVAWAASGLYVAAEVALALASRTWTPYVALVERTISDLGTSAASHPVPMNATFVAVGLLKLAGAVLTRPLWPLDGPAGRLAGAGLVCLALAGIGGVVVGLAPVDTRVTAHVVGAALQLPGAIGPLLVGLAVRHRDPVFGRVSVVCGVVGTVAFVLFAAGAPGVLGLGAGAVERVGIWPMTLWACAAGLLLLRRPAG